MRFRPLSFAGSSSNVRPEGRTNHAAVSLPPGVQGSSSIVSPSPGTTLPATASCAEGGTVVGRFFLFGGCVYLPTPRLVTSYGVVTISVVQDHSSPRTRDPAPRGGYVAKWEDMSPPGIATSPGVAASASAATVGWSPRPRHSCGAGWVGGSRIAVVGGADTDGSPLADACIFDVASRSWTRVIEFASSLRREMAAALVIRTGGSEMSFGGDDDGHRDGVGAGREDSWTMLMIGGSCQGEALADAVVVTGATTDRGQAISLGEHPLLRRVCHSAVPLSVGGSWALVGGASPLFNDLPVDVKIGVVTRRAQDDHEHVELTSTEPFARQLVCGAPPTQTITSCHFGLGQSVAVVAAPQLGGRDPLLATCRSSPHRVFLGAGLQPNTATSRFELFEWIDW